MRTLKTFLSLSAMAMTLTAIAQAPAEPPQPQPVPPQPQNPQPQNPRPQNPQPQNPQRPGQSWIAAPAPGQPGAPDPRIGANERARDLQLRNAQERVNVMYRVLDGKREKAAFLGVNGSPVTPALREQLKLPAGIGMVVDFVEPKSPADEAGLKQYDVLHKLDDQLLVNAHQLAVLVRTHKAGEEITLTIIRQGESKPIKAKLVEKEVAALDDRNPWGVPPGPWGSDMPGGQAMTGFAPAGDVLVTTNNVFRDGVQMRWDDDQNTVLITSDGPGRRRLIARDKEGKTIFNGPINNESDLKALPPEIREKLKKMEKLPGVQFQPPTTRPSNLAPGIVPTGVIRLRVDPAGGGERPQRIEIIENRIENDSNQ